MPPRKLYVKSAFIPLPAVQLPSMPLTLHLLDPIRGLSKDNTAVSYPTLYVTDPFSFPGTFHFSERAIPGAKFVRFLGIFRMSRILVISQPALHRFHVYIIYCAPKI